MDQVREIYKTSGIAEVLLSGGQHGAFNNNNNNSSGNNNSSSNNGNNNSIRPVSLLTNNSLYYKSIYRLGNKARSIQLSNKADNIDWAAYSNNDYTDSASNSDNGPKDQQARQAGSNKPTTNNKDNKVK